MSENGSKKRKIEGPEAEELRRRVAAGVQEGFRASMGPINEKFGALAQQQNHTAMIVNALIGLLVQKGIMKEEEITEVASDMMQEAIKEQAARKVPTAPEEKSS